MRLVRTAGRKVGLELEISLETSSTLCGRKSTFFSSDHTMKFYLPVRSPYFCSYVSRKHVRIMSVNFQAQLYPATTPALSPDGSLSLERGTDTCTSSCGRSPLPVESPLYHTRQEIDKVSLHSSKRLATISLDSYQRFSQVRFKVDAIFKGKRSMFPSSGPLQDSSSCSLFDKQKAQIARWLERERHRIAEAPEPLRPLEVSKTLSVYKEKLRELYGDAYIHREWETLSKITYAKLLPRRS